MSKIERKTKVLVCAAAVHFLVDLCCIWLMHHLIGTGGGYWYLGFLLYNFCAFALQLPIGMMLDHSGEGRERGTASRNCLLTSTCGCVLLAVTALFARRSVIVILGAGLANAFFHIGCGADLLRLYDEEAPSANGKRRLGRHGAQGIFVPAGGFGLFAGALLPFGNALRMLFTVLLALSALMLSFLAYKARGDAPQEADLHVIRKAPAASGTELLISSACMYLASALHSTTELSFSFSWNDTLLAGVVIALLAVFGKAAGGLLADRIPLRFVFAFSLGCASLLMLFAEAAGAASVGLFAYHMSMPLFFSGMYDLFPERPAFAYGLVKCAIFAGYVPVYAGMNRILSRPVWICVLSAVSLLFCMLSFAFRKRSGMAWTAARDGVPSQAAARVNAGSAK